MINKELIRKELKESIEKRLEKYYRHTINKDQYEEIKNEISEVVTEVYKKYNIGFEIIIHNIHDEILIEIQEYMFPNVGIINYCDE